MESSLSYREHDLGQVYLYKLLWNYKDPINSGKSIDTAILHGSINEWQTPYLDSNICFLFFGDWNMSLQNKVIHSKINTFHRLICFNQRHLNNSKSRRKLYLNSLICLKTDLPKGRSQIPSFSVSSTMEYCLLLEDRRLEVNTTFKFCHKLLYFPYIPKRSHLSLLKITLSYMTCIFTPLPQLRYFIISQLSLTFLCIHLFLM
jgi:hypothetical protein